MRDQHGNPQYAQSPYGQQQQGGYGGNQPGSPYASNPAHAPKRKAAFGVPTLVASILAAGLVGGGVVAGATQLLEDPAITSTGSGSSSQAGPVIVNNREDVNAITAAAVKATPSVVTIKASSGSEGGTGSGIILDGEGHVLTNTHVVTLDGTAANAAIEVRMSDGKVYSAEIVGTDPLSDLAVVKIQNGSGLVPAVLGDSGKLNVGDTAVAIGSPLGLTGTVTDGIVSTLNRTISVASSAAPKEGADDPQGGDQGFQFAPPDGGQGQSTTNQGSISINVIQTDAAINPGNSGGALVNTKGEIIGVNVAIASAGGDSASSGNIGVGFSIPINHAKRVAEEIISTGKATHGQFGVSVKQKTGGFLGLRFLDRGRGRHGRARLRRGQGRRQGRRRRDEVPEPRDQRPEPADGRRARAARRRLGQGHRPPRRQGTAAGRDPRRGRRAIERSTQRDHPRGRAAPSGAVRPLPCRRRTAQRSPDTGLNPAVPALPDMVS